MRSLAAVILLSIATFSSTAVAWSSLPLPLQPSQSLLPTSFAAKSNGHYHYDVVCLQIGDDNDADYAHPEQQQLDSNRRRALLSNLLISSTSLILANPNPSMAATTDEFEAPMNDLTRQIRTSVVRGAQLIDKVDGKWERLSDNLGLGSERNKPKRNVIDAGGNQLTKKVVKSDVLSEGEVIWDDKFGYGMLQLCDEVSVTALFCLGLF